MKKIFFFLGDLSSSPGLADSLPYKHKNADEKQDETRIAIPCRNLRKSDRSQMLNQIAGNAFDAHQAKIAKRAAAGKPCRFFLMPDKAGKHQQTADSEGNDESSDDEFCCGGVREQLE